MEKPFIFVGVALLVLLQLSGSVKGADICRLFANNTVIRDPDSCSRSITCIDSVSHYTTCPQSASFFDKDAGKCVKSLSASSTSSCSISCQDKATQFVADPKSCTGYYYCSAEEVAMYGSCPQDTHFNATTQTCSRLHESECTTSSFEYCNIVANGVNFDNLLGCNRYHVCTKGVLKDQTCKDSYYQASTGQCVSKALVDCDAHPLPTDVCGTAKKPKSDAFVKDGATCRGYFYCALQADGTPDANPLWHQCPEDRFFDEKSQACVTPNSVKCTEDRCDGRTSDFVVSATSGCRHYLRCSDGVTQYERSCGNYFFDEDLGGCVASVKTYTACT
ncbi:peritrophin-44 [Drosophila ficusphila]|uniref:peritrophin-44 n=1 Tax=Drosophila ficusphila TaxID=30025 RepID=UPI0007E7D4EA|nr:peritrophin-44 [Drosophila ficusphila]